MAVATLEVKVGDVIGWVAKEGGEQFAPVVKVTDHNVTVLTHEGREIPISHEKVRPCNGGRMQRLRVLDIQNPEKADMERAAYLAVWRQRIQDYKERFETEADGTDKPVVKRGRTAHPVDNGLVEQLTSIVKKLKVTTRGEMIKELGYEPTASAWSKAVDAMLRGGEIVMTGKRRGTKYSVAGATVERVAPVVDTNVAEYAETVLAFMKNGGENFSRAQITTELPIDNGTYQAAMRLLVESKKVIKTGAKRGTRYNVA